jgi:hypothetical protein
MKKQQNQTPEFIKKAFHKIRKEYGIKAYVSKNRDLNKIDMSVCSRPYRQGYFVDYPTEVEGWGKIVFDILIAEGAESQGFKVIWSGSTCNAIELKNIDILDD